MRLETSYHYQKRKRTLDFAFKSVFRLAAFLSSIMVVIIFYFIVQRGSSVFMGEDGISLWKFLTGTVWRSDTQEYGVLFIFINTLVTGFLAALISFPISVLTALFITRMAPKALGNLLRVVVELLSAIPSIIYGLFASGFIVTMVDWFASNIFGASTFGGRSLLSVVILLALMIMPTITIMSISAIEAVDKSMTEASLALGASPVQTNFKVVLTSAKSGIFAGLILGLSRAFGEATAVSLVAGNKMYGPTVNPFDITRTLTSTMLLGMNETVGLDYDIRFSVGIVLLLTVFISNFVINYVKRRLEA